MADFYNHIKQPKELSGVDAVVTGSNSTEQFGKRSGSTLNGADEVADSIFSKAGTKYYSLHGSTE